MLSDYEELIKGLNPFIHKIQRDVQLYRIVTITLTRIGCENVHNTRNLDINAPLPDSVWPMHLEYIHFTTYITSYIQMHLEYINTQADDVLWVKVKSLLELLSEIVKRTIKKLKIQYDRSNISKQSCFLPANTIWLVCPPFIVNVIVIKSKCYCRTKTRTTFCSGRFR